MESPRAVLTTWNRGDNTAQFTINYAHLTHCGLLVPHSGSRLIQFFFLVVHPHARHGMHPQNKGISVGGGGGAGVAVFDL